MLTAFVYCTVFVGVFIAERVANKGITLFDTLQPILLGWLNDANVEYSGLAELLSANPQIGAQAQSRP
jgi:hypothetical protein